MGTILLPTALALQFQLTNHVEKNSIIGLPSHTPN